jgi:SAM-dependent methyltransferase
MTEQLRMAEISGEWPEQDLEWLGRCPACDASDRTILEENLEDLAFGAAPGVWRTWKCASCSAAYLDPRPTEQSIGRAYSGYYTHEIQDEAASAAFLEAGGLRSRLRRGYYNLIYGYRFGAASSLGVVAAMAMPQRRSFWDHGIRHLPPAPAGARLLDVGCGNGEFLWMAHKLGYTAYGLEPDGAAVDLAQGAGLGVRLGTLPKTDLPDAHFDQITLNHVFEHLHWPRASAVELLRLLKPGGRVWFSQPNLDAEGRSLFGRFWRGWETPRHLSLFGPEAFVGFLKSAGFVDVRRLPPKPDAQLYFSASLTMQHGRIPQFGVRPDSWSPRWDQLVVQANRRAMRRPQNAENITVVASRPVG